MSPPTWHGHFSYDQPTCPACGSADVTFGGTLTTLVGWVGGPDQNPNHHTQDCQCGACGLKYSREWVIRDKNAWATVWLDEGEAIYGRPVKTKYAIAGYPSCCTTGYLVRCRCGAWAKNRRSESIWDCSACGYSGKEMPKEDPKPTPTVFDRLNQDDDGLG